MAQFAESLADVPGAAHIRRQALRNTLEYYQRFVAQAAQDPARKCRSEPGNLPAVCLIL